MQYLLKTTFLILKNIKDFMILMMIFILFYCLLGMELFAYRVKFGYDGEPCPENSEGLFPDSTFNDLYKSFISVFIVFANDGWSTIYIDHYRAVNWYSSTLYFISLKIFGGYILLSLFLAILLQEYDE